ncbi:MAG TPA: prolipoprotein diacylglyceryl transferase [Dehalococcoidia bacterium]
MTPAQAVLAITINIDPDLATFGPFVISWHGLFTAIGIAVGVWLAITLGRRSGFSEDDAYGMALAAIPAGVVGARALYVLEHWREMDGLAEILAVNEGGISVWGAVIGAVLGAWLYALVRGLPKGLAADAAAPGALLAQGVGRIGDLINGEHLATASNLPWAVRYVHPNTLGELGVSVHPTVGGYEMLLDILVAAGLVLMRRWVTVGKGYVFWTYLTAYALIRFGLSELRIDEARVGDFSVPQAIALGVLAVSAVGFLVAYVSKPAAGTGAGGGQAARLRVRR